MGQPVEGGRLHFVGAEWLLQFGLIATSGASLAFLATSSADRLCGSRHRIGT